jgi:hypothetical protein
VLKRKKERKKERKREKKERYYQERKITYI